MTQIDVLTDLYGRLSTIPELTAIYDSMAPANAVGPYIVIASTNIYDGRLLNNTEKRLSITLNVWSSYKGFKECYQISSKIYKILETDFDLVSAQFVVDPNSEWRRAIITYEYFYQSDDRNK